MDCIEYIDCDCPRFASGIDSNQAFDVERFKDGGHPALETDFFERRFEHSAPGLDSFHSSLGVQHKEKREIGSPKLGFAGGENFDGVEPPCALVGNRRQIGPVTEHDVACRNTGPDDVSIVFASIFDEPFEFSIRCDTFVAARHRADALAESAIRRLASFDDVMPLRAEHFCHEGELGRLAATIDAFEYDEFPVVHASLE